MKDKELIRADRLRSNYSRFTDDQLIKIATSESDELDELGYSILKEEISRRGLFKEEEIGESVAVQGINVDASELNEMQKLVEKLPCPNCGRSDGILKMKVMREVVSVVFFSQYREKLMIGCGECINKWDRTNKIRTYVFGWWAIPGGIVNTIKAIGKNRQSSQGMKIENERLFKHFVNKEIGYLRAYKNNPEKLVSMLAKNNAKVK